jgi:hypothetical protein
VGGDHRHGLCGLDASVLSRFLLHCQLVGPPALFSRSSFLVNVGDKLESDSTGRIEWCRLAEAFLAQVIHRKNSMGKVSRLSATAVAAAVGLSWW